MLLSAVSSLRSTLLASFTVYIIDHAITLSLQCHVLCRWQLVRAHVEHLICAAGLRKKLAAAPATAAAPYSQGQKRVALLVHALTAAGVFSRAALALAMVQDPAFLKQELAAWFQKVCSGLSCPEYVVLYSFPSLYDWGMW
jgi:hypothetical protein